MEKRKWETNLYSFKGPCFQQKFAGLCKLLNYFAQLWREEIASDCKKREPFPLLFSFLNRQTLLSKWCLLVGQEMSHHHSDPICQRFVGLLFEGKYRLTHLPLHLPCLNRQALGPATSAWTSAGNCIWRKTEKSTNYHLSLSKKKQKFEINNFFIHCLNLMKVGWFWFIFDVL